MGNFSKVKTRIAPSPTGNLHLGTVRTALYNMLFARRHGGEFIFRLEDTDRERSKEEHTLEIIDGFKWLNISWDGDMLRQSEREANYQKYIDQLLESGRAYKCYATPEELEAMRKEQRANKKPEGYDNRGRNLSDEQIKAYQDEGRKYVIRLNLGEDRDIKWHDLVRGEMSVNTKDLGGDMVIQKFNGQVLYNFAVVVDDYEMTISHVFRGEDHLTNTAKQITIFEALGFEVPDYGHLPLIFTPDKQKLSKRKHGELAGVAKYKREGYLPEALVNYLVATSYTPPELKGGSDKEKPELGKEIYTTEETQKDFDISGVSKSPAIYDLKKLNWYNKEYIKEFKHDELMNYLKPYLSYDLSKFSAEDQALLIDSIRGNLDKFEDINNNLNYFFEDQDIPDDLKKFIEKGNELLKELVNRFENLDFAKHESMKDAINKLGEEMGLKGKNLFFPIRIAVSSRNHGPDLGVVFYLLGKEKTRARLEEALKITI